MSKQPTNIVNERWSHEAAIQKSLMRYYQSEGESYRKIASKMTALTGEPHSQSTVARRFKSGIIPTAELLLYLKIWRITPKEFFEDLQY